MAAGTMSLAAVADRSTCQLTHHGRRSGKPYQVTVWFLVEGDTVYLSTARRTRQWVRNVRVRRDVALQIGGERFTGSVEPVEDPAGQRHVTDLLVAKYWYLRPFVGLARLLGFDPTPDASFRVHLAP